MLVAAPRARAKTSDVAGTLPIEAASFLADPVRSRMYATVPASNGVAVIDTTTLTVIATVFTGSGPTKMAIAPDAKTLYVLNTGSTLAAIGVLDLDTLQARPALSLPGAPSSIAAGADGRVYAAYGWTLYQLDSRTSAIQANLTDLDPTFHATALAASPDGKTLYAAGQREVRLLDVSTPAATFLPDRLPFGVIDGSDFFLGPGGHRLAATFATRDFSGSWTVICDLAAPDGLSPVFLTDNDRQIRHLALGNDDAVLYKLSGFPTQPYRVTALDAATLATIAEIGVPCPYAAFVSFYATEFAVDNTGSYLFVGESPEFSDSHEKRGPLTVILKTGRGPLRPPTALPTVTVRAAAPEASYAAGQDGEFILERTGDLSQPLLVHYKLGGTATGQNYAAADSRERLIKAGHGSVRFRLKIREPWSAASVTTAEIRLAKDPFYKVGQPRTSAIFLRP